jgi:predicted DCC family thiol-disulfide oxidoreductase YuxK
MVFDGNCGFCRAWVARWQAAAQGRVDFEPSTSALLRHPELAAAAPNDAVLLVCGSESDRCW